MFITIIIVIKNNEYDTRIKRWKQLVSKADCIKLIKIELKIGFYLCQVVPIRLRNNDLLHLTVVFHSGACVLNLAAAANYFTSKTMKSYRNYNKNKTEKNSSRKFIQAHFIWFSAYIRLVNDWVK